MPTSDETLDSSAATLLVMALLIAESWLADENHTVGRRYDTIVLLTVNKQRRLRDESSLWLYFYAKGGRV